MTKAFLAEPSRVELNGVDVTHIMNITIDDLRRRFESIESLDYHHTVEVEFGEYGTGTLEFRPMHRTYGNDPSTALDVLGFALGHAEYDTTNDVIDVISTDNLDSTTTLASTQRIVEIRQVEATSSQKIDNEGGAEEAWAQSFVAGGEDIYLIRLKLYDTAGTKLESFDIEIWDDDGGSPGKPNAQLASTNTVTVNCSAGSDDETNAYIGALTSGTGFGDATWETIDMSASTPDIMDGEDLAIGTTHWLVIRNTATTTDDLFVCFTSNDQYEGGRCLRDDDVGNSPVWGDAAAGALDLSFIMQFYTADGLQLDFYDYSSATEGLHYTFKKVKCTSDSGISASPMQAAQGTLKWVSEDVVVTSI